MLTIQQYTPQDYFDEASENIQNVIRDGTVRNATNSIAKGHELTEEQTYKLENETVFVLLAMEPGEDFIQNLTENLSIDTELAESIAFDVHDQLFQQVENEIETTRFVFNTYEQQLANNGDIAQTSVPTTPIEVPIPAQQREDSIVQPLRTMEQDIHKIHGYGISEQVSTSDEQKNATLETESNDLSLSEHLEEEIVQATSQEATLGERPELAKVPTYTENQSG
ncbi:MAG: hypothetical protein ACI9VM_000858 [Candidatus Azotimanducaceae bacterium]|jgi:hypothetical protein